MDMLIPEAAILSISSPGVSVVGTGSEARDLARRLNTEMGDLVTNSSNLGFFGTLPDWSDVDGTVAELDYLYETQKLCHGVTVFTSYGSKLLGDPAYAPIWKRLQQHKALVFIHPNGLDIVPSVIGPGLPQYIVDFLWATTRTAIDLVTTGTLSAAPEVDVILSHAGGTLPYAGTRALESLLIPEIAAIAAVNYTEARAQFQRFYYDLALSTSGAQLLGLLEFAGPDKVVFGSDFPYAPDGVVAAMTALLRQFQATDPRGSELAQSVLRNNALSLLKKHAS